MAEYGADGLGLPWRTAILDLLGVVNAGWHVTLYKRAEQGTPHTWAATARDPGDAGATEVCVFGPCLDVAISRLGAEMCAQWNKEDLDDVRPQRDRPALDE